MTRFDWVVKGSSTSILEKNKMTWWHKMCPDASRSGLRMGTWIWTKETELRGRNVRITMSGREYSTVFMDVGLVT